MGFYGNITNTSNTTFSFDRIYPNRLVMDANANNDGIFIGRYVLVEYQNTAAYPVVYIKNSKFYSSPNCEAATQIKFLTGTRADNTDVNKDGYFDGVYENEIVQNYVNLKQNGNNITFDKIEYYKCTGGVGGFATFEKTTPANQSDYIKNFGIDEMHYSNEKSFKGYDSTVWTKASVESEGRLITKYVQIADLNSVVPTFDIAADAPTEQPLTPHFDADSTNVYYKLHMQTPFGFRVKATSADKSDEQAVHYTTKYDTETNTTTTTTKTVDADIFYNKDALTFRKNDTSNRVTESGIDEIKIVPTGKSDNFSTKYSHYSNGENIGDIQELSVHLPSVGYMVSQGWDIIHGPNRDDAQTDSNSSLQGRLDSFKAMEKNAIPMKRNSDGTFVGSRINGNSNRIVETDKILEENLSTSFDQDDAWIRTEINTTGLNNTNKLSGISIHHTWHKQADTTSITNKNSDNVSSSKASDKIDLYTPIVDKAGHVVGKNTETVTLPYGFKYIDVANDGKEKVAAPAFTAGTQIADNTQDTLKLTTSNKWILLDGSSEDTVQFGHLLKTVPITTSTQSLSDETSQTVTFKVYDDSFDEAGHHNGRDTKTITMPFGYGKIKGDSGNTEATATFDELTISANDNWIATTVSKDTVNITHTGPVFTSTRNESNKTPNFGDTFTIEDWVFDDKGHKSNLSTHSIKIPKGSLNDLTATSSSVLTGISMIDETGVITQTNNDVGKLSLTGYVQGSDKTDIGSGDTINSAFAKLQNQITYEENRINTILTGENDLTGTLDTFIELQSYINEHGQEAADMAKAIENEIARAKEAEEANQQAISDEAIRADLAEKALGTRIDNLDYEKTRVSNYYISSIKQTDGLVEVGTTLLPIRTVTSGTTNGTILVNGSAINVGGLKSAAYTDSSDYARADVLNTEFTYGDDKKTIQDLMNIVKTQADIIADLTTRIEALELETETPVEGE